MPPQCVTVMPVYNEAECIGSVCQAWLQQMEGVDGLLLVVDDGSCDATGAILDRLAAAEQRLLVLHQLNAGHGPAIVNGYRRALHLNSEWIFQVDSDGEMPAGEFPAMWRRRGEAAFLLACRTARRVPPVRLWLSGIHGRLLELLFGISIQDPNVPFRLMRSQELRMLLTRLPEGLFAPNVFLTLLASKRGLLGNGPAIATVPRAAGSPSIRGWGTMRVAWRCLRELLWFRFVSQPWR